MGMMVLIEFQVGLLLFDIKIIVFFVDDGIYWLLGNKIFIFGGDYELLENIIYLVLVCIQGVFEGVKGFFLFIVFKILVNEDGFLGECNDVNLVGFIYKMGWCGIMLIMFNFGEKEGVVGYFVGEFNCGLFYMF